MSTATNADNPRKRVRINEVLDVDNNTTTTNTHRPMNINLYTGALASLQPAIRTVADVFFKKLTDIYKAVTNNKDKLKKFNDNEDFIPRSCRINFQLGASSFVKGSTEFTELQNKVDESNKQAAIKNREFIVDAIILEIKSTNEALRNTFCECLFKLSRIFLHSSYFDEDIPDDDIHTLSKSIVMADSSIVKYIFDNSTSNFKNFYNKKYQLRTNAQTAVQIITEPLPNGSRNIDDYDFNEGELASYEFAEHLSAGTGLDTILANRRLHLANTNATKYTLSAVFKNQYTLLMHRMVNLHWSDMINLHYTKLIDAKLHKLATTLITSDVTNNVATIVAAQPPANESIISDLIAQKFNDFKRTFKAEILNDQKTKNQKRGETTTRAVPKKSTNTKTPTKKDKKDKPSKSPPAAKTKSPKKAPQPSPATKRNKKRNSAGEAKPATTNDKQPTATTRASRKNQSTTTNNPRRSKSNQRHGTNKSKQATDK
jgi:outer membrane biosynthesis protein TonB